MGFKLYELYILLTWLKGFDLIMGNVFKDLINNFRIWIEPLA